MQTAYRSLRIESNTASRIFAQDGVNYPQTKDLWALDVE